MAFVLVAVELWFSLLSALWWRRLRGLYKLPYERDWWWEKPVLALVGRALLSRALIQLSADEWGCTPSLIVFCPRWSSCMYVLVTQSCLFATPWTTACQASLSMEFSRQEYWSGLPSPSPGDLPDPGIKPRSLALLADSLPSELPGKPQSVCSSRQYSGFLYIWVLYLRFASDRRRDTFLLPWLAGQVEEDKMGAGWCLFFSHVLGRWFWSCIIISNLSMSNRKISVALKKCPRCDHW